MKKHVALLLAAGLVLSVGCSSETKVEEEKAAPAAAQEEKKEEAAKADIWTHYDTAKWSEDYNGLKMEISKVVVTDKAPKAGNDKSEGDTSSQVGYTFKMENTTKEKFSAFPDQAKLVTSTGEQIDMPHVMLSDHVGGEIDEGVIKEGNIVFLLKRGKAEEIKWIKLEWPVRQGPMDKFDAPRKVMSVKLDLVK